MSEKKDAFDQGLDLRRKMFGKAGADDQIAAATEFTEPLQDMVTRYCFGETWHRPELDHKTRSMLTIAILTAMGKTNQVKLHVAGSLKNGVSKEEIREILMHTMIYAGVPAAVDGFIAAGEVLNSLESE